MTLQAKPFNSAFPTLHLTADVDDFVAAATAGVAACGVVVLVVLVVARVLFCFVPPS